jgi:NAD(P)-dependent dehydrogenase (short-subunit alcohol dehydrogenase family)
MRGTAGLVTGGGSGIGRACCLRFGAEGARVAVVDRDGATARTVAGEITDRGGDAVAIEADMTDAADIAAMVEETLSAFGRLDFAVNNAGTPGAYKDIADLGDDEWDRTVELNLTGVYRCMKREIAAMTARGGAIVNVASASVLKISAPNPDYVATKSGVVGLTRSAAAAYGKNGIRVNAVLPGPTMTPMLMSGFNAASRSLEEMAKRSPLGRLAEPDEIASVVVWLCSAQASIVTGAAIPAEGGRSLT